jgi:hypothetical protein
MDLLAALILSCSFHYDDHLVEALARKLSITNQYFVGDLSDLNTYDSAKSVADARRIVEAIIAKGDRPAVGFMAVPVTWAERFGRTTDYLFDGCTNISIATAMLSEYERACTLKPGHRRPQNHPSRRRRQQLSSPALRYCILRRFEIDLNITGVPENVLPEAAKLDAAPADPDVDPPAARSSLFPDNTDIARLNESIDWSSQRLFLSPTAQKPPAAASSPLLSPQRPSTPPTDRAPAAAPTAPATRRQLP